MCCLFSAISVVYQTPWKLIWKCHLLLGSVCEDVMQAKHHVCEAEKQCKACLARCSEEDREQVECQQKIIQEALEDLKPVGLEFRLEMGEWVGSDEEGDGTNKED